MRTSITGLPIRVVSLIAMIAIGLSVGATSYSQVVQSPNAKSAKVSVNETKSNGDANPPMVVEVERLVHVDSWKAKTQYSGILKAKRKSELGFERPGRIEAILVEKGDRVQKGQILAALNKAQIDSQIKKLQADRSAAFALLAELKAGPRKEAIDASKATVQEREAELSMARNTLERRRRLINTEAISREDFEQAQSAVAKLEAARSAAQKNLEELQLGTRDEKIKTQEAAIASLDASIEVAKIDLDHSIIKSPFNGVVIARQSDEGVVVSPGTAVCTISEDESMQAHFGLPSNVAESLTIGSDLMISVRDKEIKAKLKSIVPQVEADTLTLEVIATIAPAQSGLAMSGDVARLELTRSQSTEGYWLNSSAVMQGSRGLWECYVIEMEPSSDTGRVTRRTVEILHAEGDRVLARGAIRPNDLVVSSAVHRLVVGQTVKPVDASSRIPAEKPFERAGR